MATITRRTTEFSDLDFNFTLLDGSNDVGLKTDVEAVKQSIKSLILTRHYERPFPPSIKIKSGIVK